MIYITQRTHLLSLLFKIQSKINCNSFFVGAFKPPHAPTAKNKREDHTHTYILKHKL